MSKPAGPRRPICCPPHSSASLILIYSLATTPGSALTVPLHLPLRHAPGGHRFSARGAALPGCQACTVCQGLVCRTPWLIPVASPWLCPLSRGSAVGAVLGLRGGVAALALVGISGCPLVRSVVATSRAPGTVPMAPHRTRGLGAAGSALLGPLLQKTGGTLGLAGQIITPAGHG